MPPLGHLTTSGASPVLPSMQLLTSNVLGCPYKYFRVCGLFLLLAFLKMYIVEGSLDKERGFIALVAFVNFQEENVEDPG